MPPDTVRHQKQDTRQLAPEREHATETTVAARVSHRTKAALKKLAEDRGTDISKLVARLIRQELDRAGDKEQAHDTPAATDVMRMAWSHDLPTKPGIYFVRTWNPIRNEWSVSAAKVVEVQDELHALIAGWSDPQQVGACRQAREWSEPIPEPAEAADPQEPPAADAV